MKNFNVTKTKQVRVKQAEENKVVKVALGGDRGFKELENKKLILMMCLSRNNKEMKLTSKATISPEVYCEEANDKINQGLKEVKTMTYF